MASPLAPEPCEHRTIEHYLRRMTAKDWTPAQLANTKSRLNRWVRWLASHDVDSPLEATGDHCATYLAERLAIVAGSTVVKDHQTLSGYYGWLVTGEWIESRHRLGPMHDVPRPTVGAPTRGGCAEPPTTTSNISCARSTSAISPTPATPRSSR